MSSLHRLAIAASLLLIGCGRTAPAPFSSENPFATASPLLYQAPPFDKIHDADYQPALEDGMRVQLARSRAAIATIRRAPTFDNTIVAMEQTGAAAAPRANESFQAVTAGEHGRHPAEDADDRGAASWPRTPTPST